MISIDRIKGEILADRKKASILGSLAAVALILGVRAMVSGGGSPAANARASTGNVSESTNSAAAVSESSSEDRVRELISRWRASSQSSQSHRDLFALSNADFPHASEPEPTRGESAKSADQSDDESDARETIANAINLITLKSTLVGRRPIAVVSISSLTGGRDILIRPGDTIVGLSVVEITSGRVVLDLDGTRAELKVKSPLE